MAGNAHRRPPRWNESGCGIDGIARSLQSREVTERLRIRRGLGSSGRVDRWGSRVDRSVMVDECPMTEDCPGYDRDRRSCLLRPGDCEFSPADGEAVLVFETLEALTPDASAEAGSL
jgi:hypothetical protein